MCVADTEVRESDVSAEGDLWLRFIFVFYRRLRRSGGWREGGAQTLADALPRRQNLRRPNHSLGRRTTPPLSRALRASYARSRARRPFDRRIPTHHHHTLLLMDELCAAIHTQFNLYICLPSLLKCESLSQREVPKQQTFRWIFG